MHDCVYLYSTGLDLGAVVITILSQGDAYHSARAREQREQWLEQLSSVTNGDQVS